MSKRKITIEIDNLTEPQAIAIENLLANWRFMGSAGMSRWTSFYCDGDGDFKPKILIDGRKPEVSKIVDDKQFWQGSEYRIDFDAIAWALRESKNQE